MRSRTKLIAAALVTAALAAGSAGAAVASTSGTKRGAPAGTVSAGVKRAGSSNPSGPPGGSKAANAKAANAKAVPQPGTDAFTAAVAAELHVSTARAESALRPLLTAGTADSSSREFAAVVPRSGSWSRWPRAGCCVQSGGDRFYRSANARALPGSGLGLAIVRRIADVHNGTVEASPLPRGVTFRFSLPELDQPGTEDDAASGRADTVSHD